MTQSENPANDLAVLKAILETAMDAIITIDDKGSIISANSATEALFGYSIEQLIGENVKMLMPNPYDVEHDAYLAAYSRTGIRNIIGKGREVAGLRQDGTTFPMHLTVSEMQIEGRSIYAGIIRDISTLTERQARLEAIMNNAVDAIVTIDECGNIDSVNPATERVFGYAASELIGQNVKLLMPNPFRDEHDKYIRNYCETGIARIIGIGREATGQRKDGSTFPLHLAVSEIRIGDRRLFTGIVRDISDLKKVEQQLEEMNEQLENRVQRRTEELRQAQAELVRAEKFSTLGKVSGGIAHEIRNPLNAVKTSAYYLLNAKQASPEKIREHLERIDRQVTMIDNVVTALSDVAKLPEANLIPLDFEPVVRSAVSSISWPGNIDIKFNLPRGLPEVLADESQIIIAFKNLVRNARDAMSDGGTLTVSAKPAKDFVELSVCDTGTGISTEDLQNILEPLFTTKARGMGLGLPITRAIVEKNHGTLSVDSQLGKGSCFRIQLKRG